MNVTREDCETTFYKYGVYTLEGQSTTEGGSMSDELIVRENDFLAQLDDAYERGLIDVNDFNEIILLVTDDDLDFGPEGGGPKNDAILDPMLWRTAEGDVIRIPDMATTHLFNAMKMVFNHLASAHGGEPVWFVQEYDDYHWNAVTGPKELARVVITMLAEIDKRDDLPQKYVQPLALIRNQIFAQRRLNP